MYFYDFKLSKFNCINLNTGSIVTSLFENDGRIMKNILKDIDIPQSSYRLAKINSYVNSDKLVLKVLKYYKIRILSEEECYVINKLFNNYFTAVYYCDSISIEKYYKEFQNKYDLLYNSLLRPICLIVDFLYDTLILRDTREAFKIKIDKAYKFIKCNDGFFYSCFGLFKDLIFSFYYANSGKNDLFKRYKEKILYYVEKEYRLKGLVYYGLSTMNYWTKNTLGAVDYSKKAIEIYYKDHCIKRLTKIKSNLILYLLLGHSLYEAREIYEGLSCYLQFNKDDKLERILYIYDCFFLIEEKQYQFALDKIKAFIENYTLIGEMKVYLAFCYYKLNNLDKLIQLYNEFDDNCIRDVIPYKGAINLLISLAKEDLKKNVLKAYNEYVDSSYLISNSYYFELLQMEMLNFFNNQTT